MTGPKIIIGLTEFVTIYGKKKHVKIKARIDTGATNSSIDANLASELGFETVLKSKKIKSAHGIRMRPVVEFDVTIGGKKMTTEFTLAAREHMKYKVLISQKALKHSFIIDP